MKNRLTLLIGLLVAGLLLAYMFVFTVREDASEVAVVTTLNRATPPAYTAEGQIDWSNPGSVRGPGMYLRLPWPIQQVYRYSTQLRLLEDNDMELATADGYAVIVRPYLAWRVRDPLAFFTKYQNNLAAAEQQLQGLLRNARGVISQYRFDELVNTDPAKFKLPQIEQKVLDAVKAAQKASGQDHGIDVEYLGIRRVVVSEKVTEGVFTAMRDNRKRLAANVKTDGEARAKNIRSEAQSIRKRILSFVDQRAQEIRTEGETRAVQNYARFQDNEELAIFLRQLETLKVILAKNTIFVLDAQKTMPTDLLSTEGGVREAK